MKTAVLLAAYNGSTYLPALLDSLAASDVQIYWPFSEEFDETVNVIDIISTGVSEIIMGIRPVDDYDQILQEWYDAGGQLMVDAVNKYYGDAE